MTDTANLHAELKADVASAASWGAIIAGAAVALAVMILLVLLGAGFGLAAISPWPHAGAGAAKIGAAAVIWLVVTQWIAALLGGYITGRLRTKWVGAHSHEVFFRDTAHGFVAWAVATVVGAAFLATGLNAALDLTGPTAMTQSGSRGDHGAYWVDSLFRGNDQETAQVDDATRDEARRIVIVDTADANRAEADRAYLAQLVASGTGLDPAAATARVDQVTAAMRQAADGTRRAGARLAIATAIAMLIGAFIASVAAAHGGRLRDESSP